MAGINVRLKLGETEQNITVNPSREYYDFRQRVASQLDLHCRFTINGIDDHSALTQSSFHLRTKVKLGDFELRNGQVLTVVTGNADSSASVTECPRTGSSKTVHFSADETVANLMERIVVEFGRDFKLSSPEQFILIFNSIVMKRNTKLLVYNIEENGDAHEIIILKINFDLPANEMMQLQNNYKSLEKILDQDNYFQCGEFALRRYQFREDHQFKATKEMVRDVFSHIRGAGPNIIDFKDLFCLINNGIQEFYVATEYLDLGSLSDWYTSEQRGLSKPEVFQILPQILDGVEHLHQKSILHRNLKCSNILIVRKDPWEVKISDLRMSKFYMGERDQMNNPQVNSNNSSVKGAWYSPEMIQQRNLSWASDIWMVGATTLEMVTGKPPFAGVKEHERTISICQNGTIPHNQEGGIVEFLNGCLQKGFCQRKSIDDLRIILGRRQADF